MRRYRIIKLTEANVFVTSLPVLEGNICYSDKIPKILNCCKFWFYGLLCENLLN